MQSYYRFRFGPEFLYIRSGHRGSKKREMRDFMLSFVVEMLSCQKYYI